MIVPKIPSYETRQTKTKFRDKERERDQPKRGERKASTAINTPSHSPFTSHKHPSSFLHIAL